VYVAVCVAVRVAEHVEMCCSVLQCVARTSSDSATRIRSTIRVCVLQCVTVRVAVHVSVRVALCATVCVAVCCSALQVPRATQPRLRAEIWWCCLTDTLLRHTQCLTAPPAPAAALCVT